MQDDFIQSIEKIEKTAEERVVQARAEADAIRKEAKLRAATIVREAEQEGKEVMQGLQDPAKLPPLEALEFPVDQIRERQELAVREILRSLGD